MEGKTIDRSKTGVGRVAVAGATRRVRRVVTDGVERESVVAGEEGAKSGAGAEFGVALGHQGVGGWCNVFQHSAGGLIM